MNILHLIAYLGKAQGGPVESLRLLASAQAELSNNVRVLHTGINSDGELARFPENINIINASSFGPMRYTPKLIDNAIDNDFRPDVIHSHGMWLDVNRQAAKLSAIQGIPHVISPCGMLRKGALQISKWKKKILWIGFQKRALSSADIIHAKSYAEASEIIQYLPKAKIEMIPNPIELPPKNATIKGINNIKSFKKSFFNHFGILPSKRVLLFVGRVHPVKGLERLIEAWLSVYEKYREWCLVIMGPDENGYRTKIKSMLNPQVKNRQFTGTEDVYAPTGVYFFDGIYGERRWQVYNAADLFIAPSDFENFGQSIAEALCAGVPVITTKGTPWKELEEAGCGWWVDPSPIAIASALQKAMALSEAERMAKGQIGKGLVQSFSPHKVAEEMCSMYESILNNRSKNTVLS